MTRYGDDARHRAPTKGLGSWLRRAGVLLALVPLTACFDLEHDITLAGDGSGKLRLALLTEALSDEEINLDAILKGGENEVEVRNYTEDGIFIHEEKMAFPSLTSLSLPDDQLSVTIRDRTLWGMGPTRATFTRVVNPLGEESDSLGLVERVFADRTYTFRLTLPGMIGTIHPVMIAGLEAKPERSGNTITWRIPLGLMARSEGVTFKVDFMTFDPIEPSQSSPSEEGLPDVVTQSL